jgi:uncharacterized protein YegL
LRLPQSPSWADPAAGPAPGPHAATPSRPAIQPVYLVVDGSTAAAPLVAATNAGLADVWQTLAGRPDAAGHVRVAVLAYADGVVPVVPLGPVGPGEEPPEVSAYGQPVLAPLFDALTTMIADDIAALKASGHGVQRPAVFMVCAQPAADPLDWPAAHARLMDRSTNPAGPNIFCFGVARAEPAVLRQIATPGGSALLAGIGTDPADALRTLWSALSSGIALAGSTLAAGAPRVGVPTPSGFVPAP